MKRFLELKLNNFKEVSEKLNHFKEINEKIKEAYWHLDVHNPPLSPKYKIQEGVYIIPKLSVRGIWIEGA